MSLFGVATPIRNSMRPDLALDHHIAVPRSPSRRPRCETRRLRFRTRGSRCRGFCAYRTQFIRWKTRYPFSRRLPYFAPVVPRDGARSFIMARWVVPSPKSVIEGRRNEHCTSCIPAPHCGDGLASRAVASCHSLASQRTSFAGWLAPSLWFALDESRPLAFLRDFGRDGRPCGRSRKARRPNNLFRLFLRRRKSKAIHPEVVSTRYVRLAAPTLDALALQRPRH